MNKREEEIKENANVVGGFSEDFTKKLLNMSEEDFKSWKEEFTEDVLTPSRNNSFKKYIGKQNGTKRRRFIK